MDWLTISTEFFYFKRAEAGWCHFLKKQDIKQIKMFVLHLKDPKNWQQCAVMFDKTCAKASW